MMTQLFLDSSAAFTSRDISSGTMKACEFVIFRARLRQMPNVLEMFRKTVMKSDMIMSSITQDKFKLIKPSRISHKAVDQIGKLGF